MKKKERKKTENEIQVKSKLLMVQKNIKAYIKRRQIINKAIEENNIPCVLMMGADISEFKI